MSNLDDFLKNVFSTTPSKKERERRASTRAKAERLERELKALTRGVKKEKAKPVWQPLAYTLILHHTTCTACGNTSASPNCHILIKRENHLLGTHYSPAETLTLDLPREIEHIYHDVPACERCFDLPFILDRAISTFITFPEEPSVHGH